MSGAREPNSNNEYNSNNNASVTSVVNNSTNTAMVNGNNSGNFEMTTNSLKQFNDGDSNLQNKVRQIGDNLEKLSLFSNIIENAIAKISELKNRIASLTSDNGDKQEISKLMKEKEKLMKLLVTIDDLLNKKTNTMEDKVESLKQAMTDENQVLSNQQITGGRRHSKKKSRKNANKTRRIK